MRRQSGSITAFMLLTLVLFIAGSAVVDHYIDDEQADELTQSFLRD